MKLLFVQPSINPPGGGNLVACWMLQALRDDHDLTLLTWTPPDLAECNRFFGTSLRPSDFTLRLVPIVARVLGRATPCHMSLLKDSYLLRRAVDAAEAFDLVVSANNECDLGGRGVTYVHYPRLDFDRGAEERRWYHDPERMRRAYYRLCGRIARFSPERVVANRTLVNADWIGARLRGLHGVETTTLPPPVPGEFPAVPWAEREDGFVAIGRISPEKRFGRIIDLVARLRARGHALGLHIVGTVGSDRYGRDVRRRVRAHADWATLHENIDRTALLALVARQRYGVHAMVDEHFGIAVAEMVRAGCIVFAPDNGGPREILGDAPHLLYGCTEDAEAKILAVLRDERMQASLRAHLAGRAELFTPARFVEAVRAVVREAGEPAGAPAR